MGGISSTHLDNVSSRSTSLAMIWEGGESIQHRKDVGSRDRRRQMGGVGRRREGGAEKGKGMERKGRGKGWRRKRERGGRGKSERGSGEVDKRKEISSPHG